MVSTLSEPIVAQEGEKKPGFTDIESKRCVLIMHEAAMTLAERHGGKIQRYLRNYGQQMINGLAEQLAAAVPGEHRQIQEQACGYRHYGIAGGSYPANASKTIPSYFKNKTPFEN